MSQKEIAFILAKFKNNFLSPVIKCHNNNQST